MKLEVRCCCDPGKLLGHLEHPNLQKSGDRCRFPIVVGGNVAKLHGEIETTVIELTVEELLLPFGGMKLAVKNRDYPIDVLRAVPGFEEMRPSENRRRSRA